MDVEVHHRRVQATWIAGRDEGRVPCREEHGHMDPASRDRWTGTWDVADQGQTCLEVGDHEVRGRGHWDLVEA